MKDIYNIVRQHFLNGVYAYALFGFYALTFAPFITRFITFGEKSTFVAVLGFIMLIAEFFAFSFKLKMIRIRSQEKRIAYRNATGKDILPGPGLLVFFGFFMRIAFRLAFIMVSMTALGFPCSETKMSPEGVAVLSTGFFLDMCGMVYLYFNSTLSTYKPHTRREWLEEKRKEEEWNRVNIPLASSPGYYWKELFSDIILQVYALMLFTSFWSYINQRGIEMLYGAISENLSAWGAAWRLFPMLIMMVIVGLMPIRIAYWIEDSTMAFTRKEKLGMWLIFLLVSIFTCAPAILKFITLYIFPFKAGEGLIPSQYLAFFAPVLLVALILAVRILLFRKKAIPQPAASDDPGTEVNGIRELQGS